MKFDSVYDLNKAVLGKTVAVPVIYRNHLENKNDRVQYAFDIQDMLDIEKQKEVMLKHPIKLEKHTVLTTLPILPNVQSKRFG